MDIIILELKNVADDLIKEIKNLASNVLNNGFFNEGYDKVVIGIILNRYTGKINEYSKRNNLSGDEKKLLDQLEKSFVRLLDIKNNTNKYSTIRDDSEEIDRVATDLINVTNELFYSGKSVTHELRIIANRFLSDCLNLATNLSDDGSCNGNWHLSSIPYRILPKYADDIKRLRKMDDLSKDEKRLLKTLVINMSKLRTLGETDDVESDIHVRFDITSHIDDIYDGIDNELKRTVT
jgi:hypothetical protein